MTSARVPIVDIESTTGEVAWLFRASLELRSRVPHSSRVWGANIPRIAKLQLLLGMPLQREGAGGVLPCRLKEMAVLKTSYVNACAYWIGHNTALGQASGITTQQVAAIASDGYLDSKIFSRRERVAILWADHVARNTAYERDDVFEEVRQHFDDAELVELTGVCGYFALNNRFQDSLHLPLEDSDEVDKIKLSVKANPDRLKAFLKALVEQWPEEGYGAEGGKRDKANPGQERADSGFQTRESTDAERTTLSKRAGRARCRVSLLDQATAPKDSRAMLSAVDRLLGGTPNSARAWAHVPHVGKMFFPFYHALEREGIGGVLSGRLKAIALVTTAYTNAAPNGLAQYKALAYASGLSEAQVTQLCSTELPTSFSGREMTAAEWAREVATNAAKRNASAFGRLVQHFNQAEIVELTGLCATANMTTLMYNALRVPPDDPLVLCRLAQSTRIDPLQIKEYLSTVLDHWPGAMT